MQCKIYVIYEWGKNRGTSNFLTANTDNDFDLKLKNYIIVLSNA